MDRYCHGNEILEIKNFLSEFYFKNDETALAIFPGWGQRGIYSAAVAQATYFLESLTFSSWRLTP